MNTDTAGRLHKRASRHNTITTAARRLLCNAMGFGRGALLSVFFHFNP